MKRLVNVCLLLSFMLSLSSCAPSPGYPLVDAASVTANVDTLLRYNNWHLRLNYLFRGFDEYGNLTSDTAFLKKVSTGDYLPIHVVSKDKVWSYQLFKIDTATNADVKIVLKQIGVVAYGIHQQTGHPLPKYHFTDLNGYVYTPENTRGKIMVLKAWDTGCAPCVAEMPELNKLVDKYKNRKDIIFVSLAADPPARLKSFFKRQPFKYATVSTTSRYLQDTLNVKGYPTHWVINKRGLVVNMSYLKEDMIPALAREAAIE